MITYEQAVKAIHRLAIQFKEFAKKYNDDIETVSEYIAQQKEMEERRTNERN